MIRKIAIILSALALPAFFAGCQAYDTNHHGKSVRAEASHNVAGIIKTNPDSYRHVTQEATILLNTDDLWCRRDFTGDNISLFWGAINICDY